MVLSINSIGNSINEKEWVVKEDCVDLEAKSLCLLAQFDEETQGVL